MKVVSLKRNLTEIHKSNGDVILVSYSTPVAASTLDGFIRTKEYYSKTTSGHINKWIDDRKVEYVEQSVLDGML